MATREEIEYAIMEVLAQEKFDSTGLRARITQCVLRIAAGIKMPNGGISPPLPDLYSTATVATSTSVAYKTIGTTYQRNLFHVANDDDDQIYPPRGGDYYSFNTFLKRAQYKDLSETGEIYMCCLKGSNLYYQGIPSSSESLLVYFYRLPVAMATSAAVPDGIPPSYALDVIKHWVLADYFGDNIGVDLKQDVKYPDKAFSKHRYYTTRFYEVMQEMIEFVGAHDAEPQFFSTDSEYAEYEL